MSRRLSIQGLRQTLAVLRKRKFLGHVAALMTGAVIAQAVPVLLSPVLTRIYVPEDFAAFAIFMSVNAVISVVAAGRYDQAILLPRDDEDALNVVALSLGILVTLCAVMMVTIAVCYGSLPERWIEVLHGDWLYLLPAAVLISTSFQIVANWNNRCGRFPRLAVSRATQGSSGGAAQCVLGYAGLHTVGLIWGWLGGQLLGLVMLLRTNLPSLYGGLKHVSRSRVAANARSYRRFPLLSTWGCLFDNGGSMMVLLIVSHTFSSTVTGLFSFTLRVLAMPLFLISNALAQVLHQRIAQLSNEDASRILPYVLRAAAVLTLIAIPFVIVLSLFGVELFTFVFGSAWSEAGRYAGLLSLAVGIRFIVSPLTVVLALNHNVKSGVQWQVLYFFSVTATLSLGSHLPIEAFLKLYVVHELVLFILYFIIIVKGAQRRPEPAGTAVLSDETAP